tara:strand:- start:11371 stop:15273 length:3903 start_codon:yes stop_codon:yes gene_type:complete
MAKGKGGSISPGSSPKIDSDNLISQSDIDSLSGINQTPVEQLQENMLQPREDNVVQDEFTLPETPAIEEDTTALDEELADIDAQRDEELTQENVTTADIDPAALQRERERVPSLKERYKETLDADWGNPNLQEAWKKNMNGVFSRANRTKAVLQALGTQMSTERLKQSEGSWSAAMTSTDKEGNLNEATHPALKSNPYINARLTNIIHHPELLDAGITQKSSNPETGEVKETLVVDPALGTIISMVMEQHILTEMFAAKDEDKKEGVEFNEETMTQEVNKTYNLKRAAGRSELGKQIFAEWNRYKSFNKGEPTDTYMNKIDNVSSVVFDVLGDVAKTTYASANKNILDQRSAGNQKGDQHEFVVTPQGSEIFTRLNQHLSQLFSNPEVKPLTAPTIVETFNEKTGKYEIDKKKSAQPVYEGRMFVRRVTTFMKDLGDTARLDEAMMNLNQVGLRNDPTKEKLTYLFGIKALLSHRVPARTVEGEINPEAMFAETFKIGEKKKQELLNEKKRLNDLAEMYKRKAETAQFPAQAIYFNAQAQKKLKEFQNYNPDQIMTQEREKFINLLGAAAEYSGQMNYVTYYIQALTGRLGIQQTLYNPQSSKLIRNLIGSGNTYTWNPNENSKTERFWKAAMSAALFEKAFKKERGYKRVLASNADPYAERIKVFNEQASTNSPMYSKYVAWGEELEAMLETQEAINKTGDLKEKFLQLRNAKTLDETNQIKKSMQAMPDALKNMSPGLKATLQKQGDEAVVYANYLIELAKWNRSKNNKSQMSSTLIPEADGQTHGPGTMAVVYGSIPIAKRIGVLVPDDVAFADTKYKDLRDAMSDHMAEAFDNGIGVPGNIPVETSEAYRHILELARMDRENFLKKSPMTMGYGQELGSLKEHIYDTIYTDAAYNDGDAEKGILQTMEENGLDLERVSDFLHTMLVDSIYNTFEQSALEVNKLLKAHAYLSVWTNKLLTFKSPGGHTITVAGTVSEENPGKIEGRFTPEVGYTVKPGLIEFNDPNLTEEENKQIQKEMQDAYQGQKLRRRQGEEPYFTEKAKLYRGTPQAWAIKEDAEGNQSVGEFTIGRSQTSGIQAFDGNMISRTANDSWKKIAESLPRDLKNRIPFMVPIFDAVLGDLGSMETTMKEMNRHHLESIVNHNYTTQIFNDWYKELKEDIRAINNEEVINLEDPKYTGIKELRDDDILTSVFGRLLPYEKVPGQSMDEYKQATKQKAKAMTKAFNKTLIDQNINWDKETITGYEYKFIINTLIKILGFEQKNSQVLSTIKASQSKLKEMVKGKVSHNIDFAHFFAP